MNASIKYISIAAAASSAAVALFVLANSSITARFPFGVVFSIATSVAMVGIAAYDYSRRVRSLRAPAPLLRPAMPAGSASTNISARLDKSARTERVAA